MLMSKNFTLISFLLLLLPSCFFNKTEVSTSTFLVQGLCNSLLLKTFVESLHGASNAIIKEELGLDKDYDFDFFSPKQAQRLTLYYINDVCKCCDDVLLSVLDHSGIQNFVVNNISLGIQMEFFAGPFGEKDELVIMINDSEGQLLQCNEIIKEAVHKAHEEYKQLHHDDLYDIAKSERYPFVPHIGLGRIRSNSIREQVKDASQFAQVFERIQVRIKKTSVYLLEKSLTLENQRLFFNTICVLDMQKRVCVKSYDLQSF